MIDCPNCHNPMAPQATQGYRWVTRPIEVDCCAGCNLLWFDKSESLALTPDAVLALFQVIGRAGAARRPLSANVACPRCRHALTYTHDLARNTRFTYWRCTGGDGHLITFGQFLAEKNLIRPPSPAELAKLRATVKQISCSQCGAPVNLATDSACTHCGAAIALIDPDGIAKALRELDGARVSTAREQENTKTMLSDTQLNALFDLERMRDRDDDGRQDLLAIGAAAIGAVLGSWLS